MNINKAFGKAGNSVAVTGVALLALFLLVRYIKITNDRSKVGEFIDKSDFAGISKQSAFKKPYTKAKDDSGYSSLYKLSQFDFSVDNRIADFTEKEIITTRIVNGMKFHQILPELWIKDEDLIIPIYKIK